MTNYRLCRAKIESNRLSETDNRYLCRILPDMQEIEEIAFLPKFPNFFQTDSQFYYIGNIVWVLTIDDYQVGYILGLAESSTGQSFSTFITKINSLEEKAGVTKSSPLQLTIKSVDSSMISFYNAITKQVGTLFANGFYQLLTDKGDMYIDNGGTIIKVSHKGNLDIKAISIKEKYTETFLEAETVTEEIGSKKITAHGSIKEDIAGSKQTNIIGTKVEQVVGDSTYLYTKSKKETIGMGEQKQIATGGSKTTVLVGDYSVDVVGGNITLQSASGVTIRAGVSGITLESAGQIKLNAPQVVFNSLNVDFSPSRTIKTAGGLVTPDPVRFGPFCSIPFCLFTGVPHQGNTFISTI